MSYASLLLQEKSRGRRQKTEMEELLQKFHENDLIPPKGLSFKRLQDRLQIELKKKNKLSNTEMEELLKKFHENGLTLPKGRPSFKQLQDRLQIELKKKNPIHDKLSNLSLEELRSLHKKTIGAIPIYVHSKAKKLRKDLAAFYFDHCPTMEPSTFLTDGFSLDPIEANLQLPNVPQQLTLQSYISQLASDKVDQFLEVLTCDPIDVSEKTKQELLVQLAMEQFGDGALDFIRDYDVQTTNEMQEITSPSKKQRTDGSDENEVDFIMEEDSNHEGRNQNDYSIDVSSLSGDVLLQNLDPKKDRNLSKTKLAEKYQKILKEKHPLQQEVQQLSCEESNALLTYCDGIPTKKYQSEKVKNLLVQKCFEKSPDAPIAYLRKIQNMYRDPKNIDFGNDYAVSVNDSMEELEMRSYLANAFNVKVKKGTGKEALRKTLVEKLQEHHPLHAHLQQQNEFEIACAVKRLEEILPKEATGCIPSRRKHLAKYYFKNFPQNPLKSYKDMIFEMTYSISNLMELPLHEEETIRAYQMNQKRIKSALNSFKKPALVELGQKLGKSYDKESVGVMKSDIQEAILVQYPINPMRHLNDILLEEVQVSNPDDKPLSVNVADLETVVSKLTELNIEADGAADFESLKKLLIEKEKAAHPIMTELSFLQWPDLNDLQGTLCIEVVYPNEEDFDNLDDFEKDEITKDIARKAIAEAIFHSHPSEPLARLETLQKRIEKIDIRGYHLLPFQGVQLANPPGFNLCYLNAMSNALLSIPSIRRSVQLPLVDSASEELKNIMKKHVTDTQDLRKAIKGTSPHFNHGEQNDVQEALLKVFDTVPHHDGIYQKVTTVTNCPKCNFTNIPLKKVSSVCEQFTPAPTTSGMIQGKSTTIFEKCRNPSCEAENEVLTEKWHIEGNPDYIIFSADRTTSEQNRLQPILPNEYLKVNGENYKVKSVICHAGSTLDSGHYTTTLRLGNRWYISDDQIIGLKPVDFPPSNGYVFCYSKVRDFTTITNASSIPAPQGIVEKAPMKSTKKKATPTQHQELAKNFEENMEVLRGIREEGIALLDSNRSTVTDLRRENPLLRAGINFEAAMEKKMTKGDTCEVCKERSHDVEIMPRKKVCNRCNNERKRPIRTFSEENHMIPSPVPECIASLSNVELDAIRRYCPMLNLYCRRGGKLGFKGNTMALEQDLQPLADVLPRLPEEIPTLILQAEGKSGKPLELHVNHVKLKNALLYLKENNPGYSDITISDENLKYYEDRTEITLRTGQYDWVGFDQVDDEIVHPSDEIQESELNRDYPVPSSVVPQVVQSKDVLTLAREAIEQVGSKDPTLKFNRPSRSKDPVSEWSDYYWSRAFPNLFPDGKGDLNRPTFPGPKPSMLEWYRHLERFYDERFKKDPIFTMVVNNQHQRHSALALGNLVSEDENVKNMSMEELKKHAEDKDDEVFSKMKYYSRSLPGSSQFFHNMGSKCQAFMDHIRQRSEDGEMFNLFQTFSYSDMNWPSLHRLFKESDAYLGKIVVETEADIPFGREDQYITKRQDYLLRCDAVNKNASLVLDFFVERIETFMEEVLKPVLGLKEFVIRYEFQHRGAIHAHCLFSFEKGIGAEDMRLALKDLLNANAQEQLDTEMEKLKKFDEMQANVEAKAASQPDPEDSSLQADLDTLSKLQEDLDKLRRGRLARIFIEEFTAREMGISASHPNFDVNQWKPPYGRNNVPPFENPMRMDFQDLMDTDEHLQESYERLVNMVQTHECSHSYCLKEVELNKKEKEKLTDEAKIREQRLVLKDKKFYQCRFGFPLPYFGYEPKYLPAKDNDILDEVIKRPDLTLRGCHVIPRKGAPTIHDLNLVRNHPNVNFHIKEFLLVWRGNIDSKIILDPAQVKKYLFSYISKHEGESIDFRKACRAAVANCNDATSMKKAAQKIMMQTVNRDTPLQEAILQLKRDRNYADFSQTFHQISVGGSKSLNLHPKDMKQKLTNTDSYQDHYWNRHQDPKYLEAVQNFNAFAEDGKLDEYYSQFHKDFKNPTSPAETNLNNYIAFYNKDWTISRNQRVPLINPYFQTPPNVSKTQSYETYARGRMLQFKVDATPDNITGGFESITEAFKHFIKNAPKRLEFLKEEYEIANKQETDAANESRGEDNEASGEDNEASGEDNEARGEVDEDSNDVPDPNNLFEDLAPQVNGKPSFNFREFILK